MGLGVGAQDSMRNLEIKQRITPDLPSYITLSAPVNLYIVFVNLPVTVFLIFWDIIFLTNPPVPATVSQPGGRSALPLKISPQLPDQENTTAPTWTFTVIAIRPSPCRGGLKGPIIPLLFLALAPTARRDFICTFQDHHPSLWASDTLSLSPHLW